MPHDNIRIQLFAVIIERNAAEFKSSCLEMFNIRIYSHGAIFASAMTTAIPSTNQCFLTVDCNVIFIMNTSWHPNETNRVTDCRRAISRTLANYRKTILTSFACSRMAIYLCIACMPISTPYACCGMVIFTFTCMCHAVRTEMLYQAWNTEQKSRKTITT